MKQVKEVMSKSTISIDSSEPISKAADLMKTHNIGIIPVKKEDEVVGVITDRDLVLRVIAEQKSLQTPAKDVMSNPVWSIDAAESVEIAARMMGKQKIRRLIVIDHGHFCGMLSIGDLAIRHESDQAAGMALQSISEKDVKSEQK